MYGQGGQLVGPRPGRMNVRLRVAQLWVDVAFLIARVLFGLGAYLLLAIGLAGVYALVVAVGFASIFVLPVVGAALGAAFVAAVIARRFSSTVRDWLARRPFRRAVTETATSAGRGLAAAAVWWMFACRATTRRERAHVEAYQGVNIPIAYRPLPDSNRARLLTMAADPGTWRDLAYLLLAPAYAVVALAAIVAMWGGAVALLVSAATGGAATARSSDASWADPMTWLVIAAAAGALVVAPFATHAIIRGAATLGTALLATGEGARMRAELDEQRLRRQLAVDAAERERRRIERDLHDGAQQRLVALGMSLGLARETLPTDPVAGAALVAEAHAEAKLALAELRDLARGIHPAILADRGLDAALSELLRRTPIPVSIMVALPRRPPTSVESAAYFVVAEALTNVSRHAGASKATVTISQADGLVFVEVADNGVGGADPAIGTGLSGLTERVEALNGRMTVDSPQGGPTTIRAEFPCAS